MARKATGSVIAPKGKQRSWALRFTAYGKRRFISLGRPEDGWTRERAEAELRHVLADIERGIWQPHKPDLAGLRPLWSALIDALDGQALARVEAAVAALVEAEGVA